MPPLCRCKVDQKLLSRNSIHEMMSRTQSVRQKRDSQTGRARERCLLTQFNRKLHLSEEMKGCWVNTTFINSTICFLHHRLNSTSTKQQQQFGICLCAFLHRTPSPRGIVDWRHHVGVYVDGCVSVRRIVVPTASCV